MPGYALRQPSPRLVRTALGLLIAASSASVVWAQAAQCPEQPKNMPLAAALRQTVVVTDPNVLKQGNFSLTRTLNAIIESSPGHSGSATAAERIAMLQSMLNTFKATQFVNENVTVPVNDRPSEAALSPAKLLDPSDPDGMRPLGLFNRLDLAPADFKTCGEHRIVYGKGDPVDPTNRFLLIFEAALDNPVSETADLPARAAGCRVVARFWDGLKDKTGNDLATALESFYYKGLPATSDGVPPFKPVVQFLHFGTPAGQVRGNLFVTPPLQWELREWRLVVSQNAGVAFTPFPVNANPIPALYGARKASDPFDALKDPFKTMFVDKAESGQEQLGTLLEQLTAVDRKLIKGEADGPRKDELSASVGMEVPRRFDDFQSVSFPEDVDKPATFAGQSDIGARIGAKLKAVEACKITADHILNRAGAVSCAGCHQFARGVEIAPKVLWPAPAGNGFVHITEDHQLSPALETEFLPARRRNLDNILKPSAVPPTPPTSTPTYTYQTVRGAQQMARGDQGSRLDYLEAAAKLEREILKARDQDRSQPGAYVPVRRSH
jgi:hypothetical protein